MWLDGRFNEIYPIDGGEYIHEVWINNTGERLVATMGCMYLMHRIQIGEAFRGDSHVLGGFAPARCPRIFFSEKDQKGKEEHTHRHMLGE